MSIETIQLYTSQGSTSPLYGETICIIGKSSAGPLLEPQLLLSKSKVKQIFGDGRLVDAYAEAYDAGCRQIYLIRISGETDIEIWEEQEKAYEILEGMAVHIVVPVNSFVNDSLNFAQQLSNHCYKSGYVFGDRIGIIGTRPIQSEQDVFLNTTNLLNNQYMKNGFQNERLMDTGYAISVVVSEPIFNYGTDNEYSANGAAAYAGFLSTLLPGESPTGKKIPNVKKLRYNFPQYHSELLLMSPYSDKFVSQELLRDLFSPITIRQINPNVVYDNIEDTYIKLGNDCEIDYLNKRVLLSSNVLDQDANVYIRYAINEYKSLAEAGYVSFIDKGSKGIVCYTDVSATKEKKMFQGISSIRIVQSIIYTIREAGQDLIGESISNSPSFENFVEEYLEELVSFQLIRDFYVLFSYKTYDEVNIELTLSLFNEIKNVNVNIKIA